MQTYLYSVANRACAGSAQSLHNFIFCKSHPKQTELYRAFVTACAISDARQLPLWLNIYFLCVTSCICDEKHFSQMSFGFVHFELCCVSIIHMLPWQALWKSISYVSHKYNPCDLWPWLVYLVVGRIGTVRNRCIPRSCPTITSTTGHDWITLYDYRLLKYIPLHPN